MVIKSAEFVKSAKTYQDCPGAPFPEYAFLGRSNVGKSSLINMLTGYGKLAKTSSSPGKTQLINHFLINDAWYLCDLPGYGFAKVPVNIKKKWELMIKKYMLNRPNLMCSFILIDVRHGPMKNDLLFLEWVGENGLPFIILYTKADKLTRQRLNQNIQSFENVFARQWEPIPPFIITSTANGTGREEILKNISKWNKEFVYP